MTRCGFHTRRCCAAQAFRFFCEMVNQQAANSVRCVRKDCCAVRPASSAPVATTLTLALATLVGPCSFMLMIGMLGRIQPGKPAVLRALYTSATDVDATLDLPSYNAVLESLTESSSEPAVSAQDFGVAVFKDLVARGIGPDSRTYGLLIELCVRANNANGALRFLKRMRETGHVVTPAVRMQSLLRRGLRPGRRGFTVPHVSCPQMYEVVVRLLNEVDAEESMPQSFGSTQPRAAMGPHQQVLPTDGGVIDVPFWEAPRSTHGTADERAESDSKHAQVSDVADARVVDEVVEAGINEFAAAASDPAGVQRATAAAMAGGAVQVKVEPSTLARAEATSVDPELLQYLYDAVEEDLKVNEPTSCDRRVVGRAVD